MFIQVELVHLRTPGTKIWLNTDRISVISPDENFPKERTRITSDSNVVALVKENIDDLMHRIQGEV